MRARSHTEYIIMYIYVNVAKKMRTFAWVYNVFRLRICAIAVN